MIPRSSRLALWALALLLSLSLYYQGRAPANNGGGAAFLRAQGRGGIVVRLAGDFPRPGVYRLPDGASSVTAIKMTLPAESLPEGWEKVSTAPLASGDVLTLRLRDGEIAELSLTAMEVKERMLLGIPLDPDLLSAVEWASLPGIGPVLSERIVADRHKNGAFGSLERVLRVPGIGHRKLEGIRRYF